MNHDAALILTGPEARILATVLAECDDLGFGEPDFWGDDATHRDFRWLRDVVSLWSHGEHHGRAAHTAHPPP